MKKYCILAVFCCLSYLATAQSPVEKGLKSINRTSAEAYTVFWLTMNYKGGKPDTMVRR